MKSGSPAANAFSKADDQARFSSSLPFSRNGAAVSRAVSRTAGSRSIRPASSHAGRFAVFFFEREERAAARTRGARSASAAVASASGGPSPSKSSSDSATPRRSSSEPAIWALSSLAAAASGACAASRRVRLTRAVWPLHPFRRRFSSRTARAAGESGRTPSKRKAAIATPGKESFARRRETSRALRASASSLAKALFLESECSAVRACTAIDTSPFAARPTSSEALFSSSRIPRPRAAQETTTGSSLPFLSTARSAEAAVGSGFRANE